MRTKGLVLVLLLIVIYLAQTRAEANAYRVNPVCSSAHLNWYSQTDLDKQTTLMQQAGINWVRFDFVWIDMEPAPQTYNFSRYDAIVANAASKGISIIAILPQYSIPAWYRQNSADRASPPRDPQDYGTFAQALASHFQGKIKLYEIGNEPDLSWAWPPTPNVASYSALLKAGYTGIKAGDVAAKVISAGISNTNPEPFIQGMYANGVKGYFDYFGFHPYSSPRSPDDTSNPTSFSRLHAVRQIMLANGDDKPIMATEVGWPSTTQSGGVSETVQAQYINRVFQKIEYEDFQFVPIACIYDFLDDGNNKAHPEYNFGIVNWKYQKKISFSTLINIRQDYNNTFTPINP